MTALTDLRNELAGPAPDPERVQILIAHVTEDFDRLIVEHAAALRAVRDAERTVATGAERIQTREWWNNARDAWIERNEDAVAAARARYP